MSHNGEFGEGCFTLDMFFTIGNKVIGQSGHCIYANNGFSQLHNYAIIKYQKYLLI